MFDVGFGAVQVIIGVGLLVGPKIRLALSASIGWAFVVWYLGEGLGGIFGSGASLITGTPGAALLYGVLDVGNPGMITDPAQLVGPRESAGLRCGRGPYTGPDAPQWCNPPGRALGPASRFDPGPAGINAYLWIKDPGASDGTCNGDLRRASTGPSTRRL